MNVSSAARRRFFGALRQLRAACGRLFGALRLVVLWLGQTFDANDVAVGAGLLLIGLGLDYVHRGAALAVPGALLFLLGVLPALRSHD